MRIGKEGLETPLVLAIGAARKAGMTRKTCVGQVIVDTTVMPQGRRPPDRQPIARARP